MAFAVYDKSLGELTHKMRDYYQSNYNKPYLQHSLGQRAAPITTRSGGLEVSAYRLH